MAYSLRVFGFSHPPPFHPNAYLPKLQQRKICVCNRAHLVHALDLVRTPPDWRSGRFCCTDQKFFCLLISAAVPRLIGSIHERDGQIQHWWHKAIARHSPSEKADIQGFFPTPHMLRTRVHLREGDWCNDAQAYVDCGCLFATSNCGETQVNHFCEWLWPRRRYSNRKTCEKNHPSTIGLAVLVQYHRDCYQVWPQELTYPVFQFHYR